MRTPVEAVAFGPYRDERGSCRVMRNNYQEGA